MKGSGTDWQPQSSSEARMEDVGLIIGRSQAMQEVATLVQQVAVYPTTTVLLQGESGTGKDVVARAIHALSRPATGQFVDINCAALPETLLETELFGVEAGAYTDARLSRDGYLLRANGGTLFLDEISSMPLVLQAKLLRFLETRSFRRVGSTKELHVTLRIISATNIDLKMAVAHKTFREDLFYRLKVITISIPPLRERPEDIEPLIHHFLRLNATGDHSLLRVSPEAMELLVRYEWPGNVRELRNTIQYAEIVSNNFLISPQDLPEGIRKATSGATERLQEIKQQMNLPPEGIDLKAFLNDIERTFIQEAMMRCNRNQVHAAALLGMSRDQLRYRLSRLKVAP